MLINNHFSNQLVCLCRFHHPQAQFTADALIVQILGHFCDHHEGFTAQIA